MLLRSSLHLKYRRALRQGRTRSPPFVPDEPKQETSADDGAEELVTLWDEEEPASAEEDDTLIEEVDVDSPVMEGIVDAPEADSNDKE